MAKTINPDNWTNNWVQGTSNDAAKVRAGVEAVDENPCAKAASPEAIQAYLNGIQRSVEKRKRNLLKVSIDEWKRRFIEKGIPARQNAIALAKDKVLAHAQRAKPIYEKLHQSMPKRGATIEQNLQRVAHWAKGLSNEFNK